ncbi:MAG: hypothetical protein M3349_08875 [Actinomycetota bacterium]|nr:hypothetical protein [Actinomycetota bacterium]
MRALVVLVVAMVGCGGAGSVVIDPEMPDDVAVLATAVVASVREALPARTACLEGLRVESDPDLTDRARYLPAATTVVLRVPATAPRLTASLVHEVGHHLDAACADDALRGAFAAAQGLDPDADWDAIVGSGEEPRELFAAAVVQVVTGDADLPRHGGVTEAAVDVVARWGSGEDPGHGSTPP